MLHAYPWMADIDVNHWRNMQSLLLESAKEKLRIILIHENGELLKFVHSQKAEIVRKVDRVEDPHAVAEQVYQDNPGQADFVVVFERRAVDRYFAQFQDTWRADEDLDAFVHRQFALMDEYPDGIVTYPGPARTQLGLQWRVGASYEHGSTPSTTKSIPAAPRRSMRRSAATGRACPTARCSRPMPASVPRSAARASRRPTS